MKSKYMGSKMVPFSTIASIILLVSACGGDSQVRIEPTISASVTASSTLGLPTSPSDTAPPPTVVANTPTASEFPPTATPSPSLESIVRCMRPGEGALPAANGRIALRDSNWKEPSYFFDLSTGKKVPIDDTWLEIASPDGKLLVFYQHNTRHVVIVDAEGEVVYKLDDPDRRLMPAYWLDAQRVVLTQVTGSVPGLPTDTILIVNPYTRQQQEYQVNLPNQLTGGSYLWSGFSTFVLNPQMTHLIYIDTNLQSVLWDVNQNQAVGTYRGVDIAFTPQWTPNGMKVVFSPANPTAPNSGRSLLIRDLQGSEVWLNQGEDYQGLPGNYVWSPDGKKIIVEIEHDEAPEVFLIDLESNQIINYCFLAPFPPELWNKLSALPLQPVWSPDGNFVILNQDDENNRASAILLELSTGHTWEVAAGAYAVGWMQNDD
jgi:hypothetical protein